MGLISYMPFYLEVDMDIFDAKKKAEKIRKKAIKNLKYNSAIISINSRIVHKMTYHKNKYIYESISYLGDVIPCNIDDIRMYFESNGFETSCKDDRLKISWEFDDEEY